MEGECCESATCCDAADGDSPVGAASLRAAALAATRQRRVAAAARARGRGESSSSSPATSSSAASSSPSPSPVLSQSGGMSGSASSPRSSASASAIRSLRRGSAIVTLVASAPSTVSNLWGAAAKKVSGSLAIFKLKQSKEELTSAACQRRWEKRLLARRREVAVARDVAARPFFAAVSWMRRACRHEVLCRRPHRCQWAS